VRVFPRVATVLTSVLPILANILPICLQLLLVGLGFLLVAGLDISLQVPAIGADVLSISADSARVAASFLAVPSRGRVIPAPCDQLRSGTVSRDVLSGLSRRSAAGCENQCGNERRDLRLGHLYLLPLSRLGFFWVGAFAQPFSMRDAPYGPMLTESRANNRAAVSVRFEKGHK